MHGLNERTMEFQGCASQLYIYNCIFSNSIAQRKESYVYQYIHILLHGRPR